MKSLDYYFTSGNPDEKIIAVIHRHWFNMFLQYIPILILLAVMIVSYSLQPYIFSDFTNEAGRKLFYFVQSFLLLCIWIYGFVIWFDYYLDIWIITNKRIVNVEQKGLFSRKVSELEYKHIQDISTDVRGFFPTILNYGDLTVQTAAEMSHFIFRSVGNPYKIKSLIIKQIKKRSENSDSNKKEEKTTKKSSLDHWIK